MGKQAQNALAARLQQISSSQALEASAYSDVSTRKRARNERSATYKTAGLMTGAGERMAVVIKNLSATGARLEFFRKVDLPDRLWLSEPTLPLQTWANVVWREEGAVGVVFVDR